MSTFNDTAESATRGSDSSCTRCASLLAAVAAGDAAAFASLCDLMAPRMFGLLIRIVGDRGEAEDALQQALLEVWRRANAYNPRLSPGETWLLMIARTRGIDAVRRRRAWSTTANARGAPDGQVSARPPMNASQSEFRSAMERLSDDQRTALELAFYRGFTREQIAATLGVPVGTVKSRIRQSILTLGKALEEQGDADRH